MVDWYTWCSIPRGIDVRVCHSRIRISTSQRPAGKETDQVIYREGGTGACLNTATQ